jgi:hypothetical protein
VSPTAHPLKKVVYSHNGRSIDIVAYVEPAQANLICVEAFENGARVLYTYPDGFQCHQRETVEPMTAFSFQQQFNVPAVDHLIDDVIEQVKRWA